MAPKIMNPKRFSSPKICRTLPVLLGDVGLLAYQVATSLASLIFFRRFLENRRLAKSDPALHEARWKARFSGAAFPLAPAQTAPNPRKNGPRIMFVTRGWGELANMKPLILALRQARAEARLLFTVETRDALAAARALGDGPVTPLPFNSVVSVSRYLDRARPDLVVFYEGCSPVTLLRALHLMNIPFVGINTPMRGLTSRFRPYIFFKKWQMLALRAVCLSSADQLIDTRQILPATSDVQVTGSLKFPREMPRLAPEREAALQSWVENGSGGAPILIAGSTHDGEEEWVLRAFALVKKAWPLTSIAPVLLLAPRQIERSSAVAALLEKQKLRYSRRSQPSILAAPCDVLLLDTLGELATAYRFGVGSVVGGTLLGRSQNITEPLIWGIPVAYGPLRGNFDHEQRTCENAGVGFRVSSPEELAAHWTQLLTSPRLREELGLKARAIIEEQNQNFDRVLEMLIRAVDDTRTRH